MSTDSIYVGKARKPRAQVGKTYKRSAASNVLKPLETQQVRHAKRTSFVIFLFVENNGCIGEQSVHLFCDNEVSFVHFNARQLFRYFVNRKVCSKMSACR